MKAKIKILGEIQRSHAIEVLRSIPLDVVHTAEFKEYKKNRSTAQRGLYWIWVGQISKHTGESELEVHRRLKKTHLIPIYMKDPETGMAETVMAIREVFRKGLIRDAKVLESAIIKHVSTNDADVKQFACYLDEIEKEAIGQDICLPHPEDVWHEAMGK